MNKSEIKFIAYGGTGSTTGSNFMVKASTTFLVDCGLMQGGEYATLENRKPFDYDPTSVSHLLVTHAHMDHIGRIPKLVRDGFSGKIYSTKETKDLAEIMYGDALKIITREAREVGLEPFYGTEDINKALSLWQTHKYHEQFNLADDISVNFKNAGHILGSSIIEVVIGGKKFVFTGDLGNSPSPLLPDNETVDDASYMVIESVYGDRNHDEKKIRDNKLLRILKETINRGGTAIIPAFSIERTQVILYAINEFIESAELPSVLVFLDSPLATSATAIYKRDPSLFKGAIREDIMSGDDIFDFKGLRVVKDNDESGNIHREKGSKIIIAGSGMSVGGRVISHERHYLSDPRSTILFVGYQAAGSLGRRIEEGAKKVTINGEEIVVKAHIESVKGYSSHMDSDHLVEFVSHTAKTLKKVFVAMGEPKSSAFLAQRLNDELDVTAIIPEKGKEYNIE